METGFHLHFTMKTPGKDFERNGAPNAHDLPESGDLVLNQGFQGARANHSSRSVEQ
jgi:hypothetical protein